MAKPKSWIFEKHISNWSLPNEEILSWLKWDPNKVFDEIVIKSEADIKFLRILNVDEKIFKQKEINQGKAVIKKSMLQIEGFVGFTSVYTLVPEEERELSFVIDFVKDEKTFKSIELKTQLIRPIVAIEHDSGQGIMVTRNNPSIPKLRFRLNSKGKARILNLSPFIEFISVTKNMEITIKEKVEKIMDTSPLFVYSSERRIPKFIVKGLGYGMIAMGFEYNDAVGNKYSSKLIDIPIKIEEKEKLEIPISSEVKGQSTILLEPKVS